MRGQRFWFSGGECDVEPAEADLSSEAIWYNLSRCGQVRLTTGPQGTEVKWVLDAPNVRNLTSVYCTLSDFTPPYVLRYFASGWFEECIVTLDGAVNRIQDVMLHGDRCLGSRAFVREYAPSQELMPKMLRETWLSGVPSEENLIECKYQPEAQHFVVERVGARTPIGRIWGTGPTSAPCLPTGAFDATVSKTYERVMAVRQPHYDQVVASFRFPDDTIRWVPYHRLILPIETNVPNCAGVWVVAEIAAVNFSVL